MSKRRKTIKVKNAGPPCPRCGRPTEERSHRAVTAKMLRQEFYYDLWFYCANRQCRTKHIMPNEHRVFPGASVTPGHAAALMDPRDEW